jgi:hypothetical protein
VQVATLAYFVGLAALASACSSNTDGRGASGCIAQATATYDFVVLVRRVDDTLWVASGDQAFARIDGADGALQATDIAASGSSAYGDAIGCGVVSGGVWCFPLAGPLIDSSDLGAGLGSGVTTTTALQVLTGTADGAAPLSNVLQIAGGMNGGGASFCAVTSDGGVWCWGYNPSGLLGYDDADRESYARPILLATGENFAAAVEVRVGFAATCARTSDAQVWCWGDNADGQLGVAPELLPGSILPVAQTLPGPATRLAASPGNTNCAILADTRVVCWGHNEYAEAGALGDHQTASSTVVLTSQGGPELLGALDLAPDRGMKAMCANTPAGLQCWGDPHGPYAVAATHSQDGVIKAPLSAYGAIDGKLLYLDAQSRLVFGAGSLPATQQPPCP